MGGCLGKKPGAVEEYEGNDEGGNVEKRRRWSSEAETQTIPLDDVFDGIYDDIKTAGDEEKKDDPYWLQPTEDGAGPDKDHGAPVEDSKIEEIGKAAPPKPAAIAGTTPARKSILRGKAGAASKDGALKIVVMDVPRGVSGKMPPAKKSSPHVVPKGRRRSKQSAKSMAVSVKSSASSAPDWSRDTRHKAGRGFVLD